MRGVLLAALLLMAWLQPGQSFYIPGVAPTEFNTADPVDVKVCAASIPRIAAWPLRGFETPINEMRRSPAHVAAHTTSRTC